MLSEFQRNQVWQGMLAAETRALYFADLASSYTRRKQWITGLSFVLASGAAATITGKSPLWVAAVASLAVAILNAYSIAVSLDRKISVMAELHSSWNRIGDQYRHLWNHTYDDNAEDALETISERERELSELGITDAPNDESRIRKWQDRVFALHSLAS